MEDDLLLFLIPNFKESFPGGGDKDSWGSSSEKSYGPKVLLEIALDLLSPSLALFPPGRRGVVGENVSL